MVAILCTSTAVNVIPHFSGLFSVRPPATFSCMMACLSRQPSNQIWLPFPEIQGIAKKNIRISCKKINAIIGVQSQPLPGFCLPLTYVKSSFISKIDSCSIISYLLFPDMNIWLLLICSAWDQVSITCRASLIICCIRYATFIVYNNVRPVLGWLPSHLHAWAFAGTWMFQGKKHIYRHDRCRKRLKSRFQGISLPEQLPFPVG